VASYHGRLHRPQAGHAAQIVGEAVRRRKSDGVPMTTVAPGDRRWSAQAPTTSRKKGKGEAHGIERGCCRGGSSPRGAVVVVAASTPAPSTVNFITGADIRRWGAEELHA
jgi:hypothetical protein